MLNKYHLRYIWFSFWNHVTGGRRWPNKMVADKMVRT